MDTVLCRAATQALGEGHLHNRTIYCTAVIRGVSEPPPPPPTPTPPRLASKVGHISQVECVLQRLKTACLPAPSCTTPRPWYHLPTLPPVSRSIWGARLLRSKTGACRLRYSSRYARCFESVPKQQPPEQNGRRHPLPLPPLPLPTLPSSLTQSTRSSASKLASGYQRRDKDMDRLVENCVCVGPLLDATTHTCLPTT